MGTTFILIGLLIFVAHLFTALFKKRRIPDVMFLMAIGILLGPVFHVISDYSIGGVGSVFASLTLIFVLVDAGVDMKIDDLRKYWKGLVEVTLLSFILTTGAVTVAGCYLGMPWTSSLLMGTMMGGTAGAIVIPLVKQMKLSEYARTVLIMESAISAVLAMVVSLSIMNSIRHQTLNFGGLVGNMVASIMMALLVGVVGGIVWATWLDRVRKLQNAFFLTPAFVFVLYGITEALGYSGPISALAFGIVLGNTDYFELSYTKKLTRHRMLPLENQEKLFFKELVFILKTFFFIYIGICIPFDNATYLLYGLGITVIIFIVRFILLQIVGRENPKNDRLIVSMMVPKGLATAVLASMPEQINMTYGMEVIPYAHMIKSIAYAVIFFSIIITSLLVLLTRKQLVDETLPYYDVSQEEVYDYE